MQEYKTIANTVVLPTDEDITKCLRVVEYLPVASAALLGEAFFLKKAQEGFQITHSYICCYDSATATYYWKDMNMGRFGVGNVTDFRMATSNSGDTVTMCWKDPVDETVGTDVANWNRTVVVVKEGSQPVSTKDGKTVTINTVRGQYAAFGDFTFNISEELGRSSEDLAGKTIYVKLFPITDSEVVTVNDANCKVFKYGVDTMSWALARELIQNGHGPDYFAKGDVIVLPKHGDFGEMEVEVLSHDTEILADQTKKHSMTVATMKLPSWSDGNDSGLVYDNCNTPYISNETADGASVPHFEVVYLPSASSQKEAGGSGSSWNKDYGDAIRTGLASKPKGIPVLVGSVWDGNGDSVSVYGTGTARANLQNTRGSYRVNIPFKTRLHASDDGKWGRKDNSTTSGPSKLPSAVAGSVIMPYSAAFSPEYAFMREVVEKTYTDDSDFLSTLQYVFSGDNRVKDTANSYAAKFLSGCSGELGYISRAAAGSSSNLAFAINPVDPTTDINGNASTTSTYSSAIKYLVPCQSVIVRSIDTTNKKITQEYLTHFRNAGADLRAIWSELRNRRDNNSAPNQDNTGRYAFAHYRRYQTNVNATASSSGQSGLESLNVLEMAKDLVRVPTRDEKYLPFKRYWRKSYIDLPSDASDLVKLLSEYYEVGGSGDAYLNRYNYSYHYLYRVAKGTSGAKIAKYTRLFNKVYTISETSGTNYVKTTYSYSSGTTPVWEYVAYTYSPTGQGTVNLTLTEVTSGNWADNTAYFEYIDGKFVRLRPDSWPAGGTRNSVPIAYDYVVGESVAAQLYTAGTYIEILNDLPRYVTKWTCNGGEEVSGGSASHDTSSPGQTTVANIKAAYDSGAKHVGVRVYGEYGTYGSSSETTVTEICEAPVTSYVVSGDPRTNPGSVTSSGTIVNIFWQGANMLRSKFGNPTWASSNLRMYLNGPFDTSLSTPKPVGYKCDPDNPDLYWNYGLSPIQQYAYNYKLRKWEPMFSTNELWFNTDVSADPFVREKYSINLHPSYIGKYVGEGIVANPTPVMAGTFIKRDLQNYNGTDTRAGGVTVDTTFPKQSFLHGFLDCKYKKTNDVNPVSGKGYYYRNAWGNYERLPDTDTWVTGGPYAHALYELNENYHNDLLDALDFLASITPVVNTTKVYNKPGSVTNGGYSEHYSFNVSLAKTTDLVWVASKEQILGKGSADKWVEANGQLWTKTGGVGNWGLKHMAKYNHHSADGYTDEVYMENDVVAGTRTSSLTDAYSLASVVWKNGTRSVDPSNSVSDRVPVTKRGYNLVMVIG